MFLNQLTEKEKEAFISLSIHAAKSNGEFAEEERNMISEYCKEMNLVFVADDIMKLDEIFDLFAKADIEEKRIALLELLGLMYADGSFDNLENQFVKNFIHAIGLTEEELVKQEELLKKYMEIIEEMATAIHI